MINVRSGVFETNSSNTHSIVICSKKEYELLEEGKLLLRRYSDDVVTYEDAVKELAEQYEGQYNIQGLSEEAILDLLRDHDIAESLDSFFDDEYLDTFSYKYKTEHGDEIVAFGKYGRDG